MKWCFRSKLAGLVLVAIAQSLLIVPPALAQSAVSPGLVRRVLNLFNPPRNRNAGASTGRQFGGATRDRCPPVTTPLTALVPQTNLGLTLDASPTLWFYVPYVSRPDSRSDLRSDLRSDSTMEFALIDAEETDVYKQNFSLPQEPGIISIQIPEQVALEAGTYRWVVSVICNAGNRSGDATVNGWIERVDAENLENQLAAAALENQMLLYSENDLWYEILTTLAQLRRDQPDDEAIATAWTELLTASGFSEGVASAPIVECCTVREQQ
jgi:hypothetical protein